MPTDYAGVDREHPLTLGHEVSGIIHTVGKNVKGYHPGQHVAIAPNFGCGVCDYCVQGDTHLCADYQAFGINMDGGFAEFMRVDARMIAQGNVMILPDTFPMDEASVLEPFSCVLNGQERIHVRLNDTVLIIGAGPIGVMHAMLAKALGASKVMIRDHSAARMDFCKQIDPWFITVPGSDLKAEVMRETNGRGVDVCITGMPFPAGPGGRAGTDGNERARTVFRRPAGRARSGRVKNQPDSLPAVDGMRFDARQCAAIPGWRQAARIRAYRTLAALLSAPLSAP